MSNTTVENVYTRQRAKELTNGHFWPLLGMFLVATGIPYLLTTAVTALLAQTNSQVVTGVGGFLLALVTTLISSGLMLGMVTVMLGLCRGASGCTVSSVFSRMGDCFKAFGLSLWVALKTLLWALPVYAVIILGTFILIPAAKAGDIPLDAAQFLLSILPFLAFILILALVIPAALRYMLSIYILADDPDCSVFDCVRKSKALMAGHKWQMVRLVLPLYLVMLVVVIVVAVVFGTVITLLGLSASSTVVSLLMTLVLYCAMAYYSVRLQLCSVLFYLKRVGDKEAA